jgi:hypothetical protein
MTLARILVFDTARSAEAYLGWARRPRRRRDQQGPPGGWALGSRWNDRLCPPTEPVLSQRDRLVLAAWNDGDTVKTLELGGQVVKTSVVPGLISSLERAV